MYRATDSNLMQHPIQGERKCSYVLHVTDTGAPAWWATWLVSKLYPPSLRHLTSYLKDLWIPSIMHRRVVEPVNRANIPSQLNVRYFIGFAVNQRQTNSIQWNEQLHVHNFIVTTLAVKHRHAKRARVIFLVIGVFVELFTVMIWLSFFELPCTARRKLEIYNL